MKILALGSEIFPLVKTGGLADVLGALPAALAAEGIETRTLIPGYPAVMNALQAAETACEWESLFGGPARLLAGSAAGLSLLALDAPHLYARPGNPYSGPDGADWPDNAQRFAALGRAAASIAQGLIPGYRPDILHAHDWQAGLAPAYLRYDGAARPPVVMTVHNLAFQGQFPAYLLGLLGLPPQAYSIEGVEYYQSIGYLKAGLYFADAITTVSPTYAAELQTDAGGMGLAGLFRSRAASVSGILNGIDTRVWNPALDSHLPTVFDAARLDARAVNKAALQQRLGLVIEPGRLLLGVVSRLAWQKGLDILLETLPDLTAMGIQLAILGAGEPPLESGFKAAARASPDRLSCTIGFDETLAHLIYAGSDAILVPSRFEPCGLTQLIAQRYGALPIVARTGGLNDTVIDANEAALAAGAATGLQFSPLDPNTLALTLRRALTLWSRPTTWQRLQHNAMALDLSWTTPAHHYATLYRRLSGGG